MKNLLKILLIAALTILDGVAYGQITNGVKISALPAAGTITGSETLPVNQAGVTVAATVNAINSLVAAQNLATSNHLAAAVSSLSSSNSASITTTSNAIQTELSLEISQRMDDFYILAGLIDSVNAYIVTNDNRMTNIVSNASAVGSALNTVSNSLNNLAAAVGVTQGQMLTNGSPISSPYLRTPSTTISSWSGNPGTAYINLGTSSYQYVTASLQSGVSLVLMATNIVDGANVSLLVNNLHGDSFTLAVSPILGQTFYYLSPTMFTIRGGIIAAMQWQVFGTNIVFSGGIAP